MPEDENKDIFIYHLILNLNNEARKNIAKAARCSKLNKK